MPNRGFLGTGAIRRAAMIATPAMMIAALAAGTAHAAPESTETALRISAGNAGSASPVSISVGSNPSPVATGQAMAYSITVTNTGVSAATGVGEEMADVGLAMQRVLEKTEDMKARADAVSELEAAGTFEDITQLGPAPDDIDRQLEQLGRSSAVDEDLAKLKAELGQGTEAAPELDSGAAAEETQR